MPSSGTNLRCPSTTLSSAGFDVAATTTDLTRGAVGEPEVPAVLVVVVVDGGTDASKPVDLFPVLEHGVSAAAARGDAGQLGEGSYPVALVLGAVILG